MLTHNIRWSHAPGNQVVPSRWQATYRGTASIRPHFLLEAAASRHLHACRTFSKQGLS